jgi:hypothetical protein
MLTVLGLAGFGGYRRDATDSPTRRLPGGERRHDGGGPTSASQRREEEEVMVMYGKHNKVYTTKQRAKLPQEYN